MVAPDFKNLKSFQKHVSARQQKVESVNTPCAIVNTTEETPRSPPGVTMSKPHKNRSNKKKRRRSAEGDANASEVAKRQHMESPPPTAVAEVSQNPPQLQAPPPAKLSLQQLPTESQMQPPPFAGGSVNNDSSEDEEQDNFSSIPSPGTIIRVATPATNLVKAAPSRQPPMGNPRTPTPVQTPVAHQPNQGVAKQEVEEEDEEDESYDSEEPEKPSGSGCMGWAVFVLILLLSVLAGVFQVQRLEWELAMGDMQLQLQDCRALVTDNERATDEFYTQELEQQVRGWKQRTKALETELATLRQECEETIDLLESQHDWGL